MYRNILIRLCAAGLFLTFTASLAPSALVEDAYAQLAPSLPNMSPGMKVPPSITTIAPAPSTPVLALPNTNAQAPHSEGSKLDSLLQQQILNLLGLVQAAISFLSTVLPAISDALQAAGLVLFLIIFVAYQIFRRRRMSLEEEQERAQSSVEPEFGGPHLDNEGNCHAPFEG
jgi:hypothetical protein